VFLCVGVGVGGGGGGGGGGGVFVPLFPSKIALCSHVPTHFRYLFLFVNFSNFCSPVPKKWLMFPCSLRYFANVPLFPKTPGRPSSVCQSQTIVSTRSAYNNNKLQEALSLTVLFSVKQGTFLYHANWLINDLELNKSTCDSLTVETSPVQFFHYDPHQDLSCKVLTRIMVYHLQSSPLSWIVNNWYIIDNSYKS